MGSRAQNPENYRPATARPGQVGMGLAPWLRQGGQSAPFRFPYSPELGGAMHRPDNQPMPITPPVQGMPTPTPVAPSQGARSNPDWAQFQAMLAAMLQQRPQAQAPQAPMAPPPTPTQNPSLTPTPPLPTPAAPPPPAAPAGNWYDSAMAARQQTDATTSAQAEAARQAELQRQAALAEQLRLQQALELSGDGERMWNRSRRASGEGGD